MTDPGTSPPYVTELFMDATKRAHLNPALQNVHLNPQRADQALVHMASGKWEVVPLQEATRLMFDGVAKCILNISRAFGERKNLPQGAQNALAMAGLMYNGEPEEYVNRARASMVAHLTNCRNAAAANKLGQ